MTVLVDDHLLWDWMVGADRVLLRAVGGERLATTNLWYARLCKSGARSARGALLGGLRVEDRQAPVAGLVRLPDDILVVPMRDLAWRMGVLVFEHSGLSTLGSEAVAAAEALGARLLTSSRDDSPGLVDGPVRGGEPSRRVPVTRNAVGRFTRCADQSW